MASGRITDPTNRSEFTAYIRSKLGEPIIELNVTDFQVNQAIDEALQYYRDYHYNGTTHSFYIHTITDQDMTNRYITLPNEVIGVVTVYDPMDTSGMGISADITSGSWQVNYDLIFSEGLLNGSFLSYFMNKQYYEMINQMVTGSRNIRYNMHDNRLYIDNTWTNYATGNRLVIECYQAIDPDTNTDVWTDRWLIRYATAKLKRQWGENISKVDATLPGGLKLNYDRIIREADDEINKIEEACLRDYSIPPRDWIA